jgi:hypothetical protein
MQAHKHYNTSGITALALATEHKRRKLYNAAHHPRHHKAVTWIARTQHELHAIYTDE